MKEKLKSKNNFIPVNLPKIFKEDKKIIHMDFWPAEVDRDYLPDVEIVGDLADGLWQLNKLLEKRHKEKLPLFDIKTRGNLRNQLTEDFAAEKDDQSCPMKPQKILWDDEFLKRLFDKQ